MPKTAGCEAGFAVEAAEDIAAFSHDRHGDESAGVRHASRSGSAVDLVAHRPEAARRFRPLTRRDEAPTARAAAS